MTVELAYLRRRAVAYAERWALSRNPLFYDFADLGGDCTNFVSQCILAGCCTMNYTPTYGWYFRSATDRAPAWTSVEYLYDFLTGADDFAAQNGGIGPYGRQIPAALAQAGDIIQLANEEGDFYHTLLITGFDGRIPLVCAHNDDAYMRPLSTYRFANARFLRPIGSRLTADLGAAYAELLRGIAYRPPVLTAPEVLLEG